MLNVFRENLKSLKWVLWVVAASMTLYMGAFFNDSCGGPAGTWAARVNGTQIPAQELLNRTRQLDQQYQQAFGADGYNQLRGSLRLGDQAMRALIDRELILADSRRMGIRATPEDVALAITQSPNFQDESGKFIGKESYEQLFTRRGSDVSTFETAVADDIVVQRWQQVVGQSVTADETELEELFRERTEKTAIKYFVAASADQPIETEISDADEAAWYAAHEDDYRRGERRRIRFLTVKRAEQRDLVEVSEAEVETYYNQNKSNYEFPEQRKARHVLVRVDASADDAVKEEARQKAESALARAQAGEDFAAIATELSDDTVSAAQGGDLGWFGRGRMVPEFEEATFATAPGELAPLTETQFGYHVIFVEDTRDAGQTPLAEVADAIRRNLKERGAADRTDAEAQRIRAAIKNAGDLEAIASSEGLDIADRIVSENDTLAGLGASPDFLPAVYDLETGGVAEPVRVLAGQAIVALAEIIPPGLAPLEDVRIEVRNDILNDRGRQTAFAQAEAAIAGNANIDDAAAYLELEATESGDLGPTSSLAAAGAGPDDLLPLLFGDAVEVGDTGTVIVPAGAMAYEVVRREAFDQDRFETEKLTLRGEIVRQRQGQLQQSLLDRMREDSKIETNNALVQQFNGLGS